MTRTPQRTPQSGELLSATGAAKLLGIGRTRFWQLRKQFNLPRVEWSTDTRPLYRRDDVLALIDARRSDDTGDADRPFDDRHGGHADDEAERYRRAWAEHETTNEPHEWPKGSDDVPDWVKDALGDD